MREFGESCRICHSSDRAPAHAYLYPTGVNKQQQILWMMMLADQADAGPNSDSCSAPSYDSAAVPELTTHSRQRIRLPDC